MKKFPKLMFETIGRITITATVFALFIASIFLASNGLIYTVKCLI